MEQSSAVSPTEQAVMREWSEKLESYGFCHKILHRNKPTFATRTPTTFRVHSSVFKKLKANYDPEFERGGIMLARPVNGKDAKYFEIYDLIFLRNTRPRNEQKYSYFFDHADMHKALTHCFSRGKNKKISLPIFFHTHPTADPKDWQESWNYYRQSCTSELDEAIANELVFDYHGFRFAMPNALVVINPKFDHQFFLGFFGGYIAPESFAEYMQQMTGKTLDSFFTSIGEWAGEDNANAAITAVGAALVIGSGIYFAKDVIPLLATINKLNIIPITASSVDRNPNYFSQILDSDKPVSIHIPTYKKDY